MNPPDPVVRFEELSAGRAMGDLTRDEERELVYIGGSLGMEPDLAFDLLMASIEVDSLQDSLEPMPASLLAKLHQSADECASEVPENIIQPKVPGWRRFASHPLAGWAAAAVVLLFFSLHKPEPPPMTPAQAEIQFRTQAPDLIERNFEGLGSFAGAGGKVVWSDSRQEGYMILSGIPVNDPQEAQYQLWIVDPKRDEAPVDGGVFDIPTDGSPVVVPIVAKLALTDPQAFVITREQPGGVVRSKQEQVVALAKN